MVAWRFRRGFGLGGKGGCFKSVVGGVSVSLVRLGLGPTAGGLISLSPFRVDVGGCSAGDESMAGWSGLGDSNVPCDATTVVYSVGI